MTEYEIDQEKKEIIRRYRKLLRHAKPFLKDDDAKIIKRAFNMSQEAHKNMRRRSGEPYIFHPIAGIPPRIRRPGTRRYRKTFWQ